MRHTLISVVFLLLLPVAVTADPCTFKTADYHKQLQQLTSVRNIEIEIAKSRKWVKNGLGILVDPAENIARKFKKKFSATIRVHYDFGTCDYAARLRQNGDHKDHIELVNGNIQQSLDVKLEEGNIASVVRFKLFLPATRNQAGEVFGTLLLRKLGILAPRTAFVDAKVNGVSTTFLFQEKDSKELLEAAGRREGPIFEGDEDIIWSFLDFEDSSLEWVSGVRMVNDKWFGRGASSRKIALQAWLELQEGYFDSHIDRETLVFFDPNARLANSTHFAIYHAIILSLNGEHALRLHNRKFYWNALEGQFEPIYYDGNLSEMILTPESFAEVGARSGTQDDLYFLRDMSQIDIALLRDQIARTVDQGFVTELAQLLDKPRPAVERWTANTKNMVLRNVDLFSRLVASNPALGAELDKADTPNAGLSWVIDYSKRRKVPQGFLELTGVNADGSYSLTCVHAEECSFEDVTPDELQELLAANMLRGKRYLLSRSTLDFTPAHSSTPFLGGSILHTSGVSVDIDSGAKTVTLTQKKSDDWFLIRNADLSNYQIVLKGVAQASDTDASEQRFNELGLTGCLTLYKVRLAGASVSAEGGGCEDSLNIVSSTGWLSRIDIDAAYSDAIDLDFSTLRVDAVTVRTAGNDCLDVSGGHYALGQVKVSGCDDKGVSVGEASSMSVADLIVDGAGKGVSSKDYSEVTLAGFETVDTDTCLEAFQKKSEFGGGLIIVENGQCANQDFFIDENSVIMFNGVRHELSN